MAKPKNISELAAKTPATIPGNEAGASVAVQKVQQNLRRLGAPLELVRKAKGSWLGQEAQAIKTYNRIHGND